MSLSLAVRIVVAGILAFAAVAKTLDGTARLAQTLQALGLSGAIAGLLRRAVPPGEFLAAFALIALSPALSALTVAAVGVSFGSLGVIGLRTQKPLPCSCFGAKTGGTLGWRQVLATPLWLACAGLIYLEPVPSLKVVLVMEILAFSATAAAVVVGLVRAARVEREGRILVDSWYTMGEPILVEVPS
jgi:hypothetical protein